MSEPSFAEVFFFTRYLFGPKTWYPGFRRTGLYGPGDRVCFQGRNATIISRFDFWARLQYDISPNPVPLGFMTYTDVDLLSALARRDIYLLEDDEHGYESPESVVGAGSTGRVRFDADPTVSRFPAALGVSFGQCW